MFIIPTISIPKIILLSNEAIEPIALFYEDCPFFNSKVASFYKSYTLYKTSSE